MSEALTRCLTPSCSRVPARGLDYCCVACARASWITPLPEVPVEGHGRACDLSRGITPASSIYGIIRAAIQELHDASPPQIEALRDALSREDGAPG